ncbi:hypothetical protein [Streptomyces luteosporeus]|uniref:hypothetical protein n=1 Tax=Streptomyces luteosporeus TaxID=173856 RepID=UPI0031D3A849
MPLQQPAAHAAAPRRAAPAGSAAAAVATAPGSAGPSPLGSARAADEVPAAAPSAGAAAGPVLPGRAVVPPRPGVPPAAYGQPHTAPARPPAGARRRGVLGVALCLVLGLGLIAGAVAGSCLAADDMGGSAEEQAYARGATVWREVPVDRLFPPAVHAEAAGPGGAPRDWNRVGVAPDSGCAGAFDPLLAKALAPVGCKRLLRATYADATSSTVTTVGVLVTEADAPAMNALRDRFAGEHLDRRADLMPRPYAVPGTPAAGFADGQRASWHIGVLTDVPAVVYAVSGFADARTGVVPQPAAGAVAPGATEVPAQAGLGHDARALADAAERAFRDAAHGREPESR